MAHTDRQPIQEVFDDIVNAAQNVWIFGKRQYGDEYVQEQIDYIDRLENYADNWFAMIGRMDEFNQILFIHNIKLQATSDFLEKQREHYRYATLRKLQ